MAEPSRSCSSAVSLVSAQEVLETTRVGGCAAVDGASVHSSPSLLGLGPGQQQQQQRQLGSMVTQQQPQQQPAAAAPSVAAQASSMQRLGGALQGVLCSGLASDFVEGLKPVMLGGSLQISTYIKLAGEAEPMFIGMFPTLQAAVDAQKQSQALVGKLPAPIARKLIEAQLAHTQAVAEATAAAAAAAATVTSAAAEATGTGAQHPPGRWLSTTSDATGVTAPRPVEVGEVAAAAPASVAAASSSTQQLLQPQQQSAAATAAPAAAGCKPASSRQADEAPMPEFAAACNAATRAGTAAAGSGSRGAGSVQPLAALTDDVINLLLRKGLHALAVVQGGQGEAAAATTSATLAAGVSQAWGRPGQQDAAAAAAASGLATHEDMPYTAPTDGNNPAAADAATAAAAARGPTGEYAVAGLGNDHHQQQQPYGSYGRGQVMHDDMAAPAAGGGNGYHGQYGGLDPMLEYAAPHTQLYRSASQGMSASSGPQLQGAPCWGAGAMQHTMAGPAPAGYGSYNQDVAAAAAAASYGGMAAGAGYGVRGAVASAAAAGGCYGVPDWSGYAGGAAAQVYAGPGAGAAAAGGGDMKRKRSDPRVNCIKSVQYRVSRFPQELHNMCVEHWERTRCARVVCNGMTGVMSVQGGRCVVSFTQHGQEVLKGVADYLRYAGEDRIKKWRRHVRMVDFPRPNNRTGELMTAEEFLCIVGYQSEQGGSKRPKYMGGMEGAGSD